MEVLLTRRQVAELLKLGRSTLNRYLAAGWIPAPVRVGNALRWRASEVERWVAAGCPRDLRGEQE